MNNFAPKPIISRGWLRALVFVPAYLVLALILSSILPPPEHTLSEQVIVNALFHYLLIFILILFFTIYIEKKDALTSEIKYDQKLFFRGMMVGSFFFFLVLLFLFLFNRMEISLGEPAILNAGKAAIFFLLIAIGEELVFRGYILRNLRLSMSSLPAVILSSLAFSAFHIFNPNITITGALNIFLTGIILGYLYLKTKNIWITTGFHFSWNFLQGAAFGIPVSGINYGGILNTSLSGPDFISGGNFGMEGSIFLTVIYGTFLLIFFRRLRDVMEEKIK